MPRAAEIIDGAVWEIQRNPKGVGIYLPEIDVWQARIEMPSSADLLLIYAVSGRFVTMLTIVASK